MTNRLSREDALLLAAYLNKFLVGALGDEVASWSEIEAEILAAAELYADALLDLAQADREREFKALAAAFGVGFDRGRTDAVVLDAFWTETRRRLRGEGPHRVARIRE